MCDQQYLFFSFPLGMDIPDIRRIIHFGVPVELDQYIQETGRGGRDGKPCQAVIIRHSNSLSGKISKDMKDYLIETTCRRKILLAVFDEEPTTLSSYQCCDLCAKSYLCCSCPKKVDCRHMSQDCFCVRWCGVFTKLERDAAKVSSLEQRDECRNTIPDMASFESDITNLHITSKVLPNNISRIYPELVLSVLNRYKHLKTVNDVLQLGALNSEDAQQILAIIDRHSSLLPGSSDEHSLSDSVQSGSDHISESDDDGV